jgi:hypothetical protein
LLERRHAQVESLRAQRELLETKLEEQEADMRLLREQVRRSIASSVNQISQ